MILVDLHLSVKNTSGCSGHKDVMPQSHFSQVKRCLCPKLEEHKLELKRGLNRAILSFFLQERNIKYIQDMTRAVVSVKPQWSGLKDGLLFSIKHISYDQIRYAEHLLYKLLDKVRFVGL